MPLCRIPKYCGLHFACCFLRSLSDGWSRRVPLPLLARQFWSTTALMIVVVACMWLLMLLNESGERSLVGQRRSLSGSAAALRLVRRLIDGLILFAGLLFTLHHFRHKPDRYVSRTRSRRHCSCPRSPEDTRKRDCGRFPDRRPSGECWRRFEPGRYPGYGGGGRPSLNPYPHS